MIDTQSNIRKANAYIVNNLSDLEGSFVKKLGEKNLQRIRDTYEKALDILDHENSTLVPRPVTFDQSKVCLEANRESAEKAEKIIYACDRVESSHLIDEYVTLQSKLTEISEVLCREYGSDFETYKRMNGFK